MKTVTFQLTTLNEIYLLIEIIKLYKLSKLLIHGESQVTRVTNRFFKNESSAAHKLVTKLLTTLIRYIISRNDKSLARRHVLPYFVHFAVNHPPLRLILALFHRRHRVLRPPSRRR